MSDHPSCEERIQAQLDGRLDDFRQYLNPVMLYTMQCLDCEYKWDDADDMADCPECGGEAECVEEFEPENRESFEEGILEITPTLMFKVGLSWGGPADGFHIYVDMQDGRIDRIDYYFQDWFDGATQTLRGGDFDVVASLFDYLGSDWQSYAGVWDRR
jgi:hypothetical protein